MSMILCSQCGALDDTDLYPEGFYRGEDDEPSDEYYCQQCNGEYGATGEDYE